MPLLTGSTTFVRLTNNWATRSLVEKARRPSSAERAEYIRVITAELIDSKTIRVWRFYVDGHGALGTPLMYAFRERENILDLFESLTGARNDVQFTCDSEVGRLICPLAGLSRPERLLPITRASWTSLNLLSSNEDRGWLAPRASARSQRIGHQCQHHRPDAPRHPASI